MVNRHSHDGEDGKKKVYETELDLNNGRNRSLRHRSSDIRSKPHQSRGCSNLRCQNSPPDYRDWKLISVAHEEGNLNDLRAQLGNDIAIKAYREGTIPFPDGAIIAAIHWQYVPSEENNKVFGRAQSFVAGPPKNMQFMVKDSKKYAATGGWGFADFTDGEPADEATHKKCFPCHEPAKAHDYVYTHYAP